MAKVDRTCEECGNGFQAKPSEIANGYAKFCCRACSHISMRRRNLIAKPPLTAERLREVVHYDADTGALTWTNPLHSRTAKPGDIAGNLRPTGYIYIGLEGKKYMGHRLAWLYMTGEWPAFEVDHINGVKNDNRWANLRDVTHTVNAQNIIRSKGRSASGLLGVKPHGGKWQASIRVDGADKWLGSFATKEEGHAAYLEAKRKHHPGCTL